MPCPGAAAGCALRRPLGRTEGVPCGTDVMMPTYACAIPASILVRVILVRVIDRLPTIAQLLETRRAEALSMPEGPAVGRLEA